MNGQIQASLSMGFLSGDVNNARNVTNTDISAVKTRSGQTASASNYKFDIDASGLISNDNTVLVRSNAGSSLKRALQVNK